MESKRTTSDEIEVRCLVSDLRIEKRDDQTDSRTITGYASVFERWSEPICGWFREQIARGAFEGCDLSDVIMCFNHDPAALLARTTSGTLTLEVADRGLKFRFDVPDTTLGNDMLVLVRRGDVSKCSFRFTVSEDRWAYADSENGMEYDERTVLRIAKLYDCSLVVYPAYKDTEASARSLETRKAEYLRRTDSQSEDIVSRSRLREREVQFYQLKNRSHE